MCSLFFAKDPCVRVPQSSFPHQLCAKEKRSGVEIGCYLVVKIEAIFFRRDAFTTFTFLISFKNSKSIIEPFQPEFEFEQTKSLVCILCTAGN